MVTRSTGCRRPGGPAGTAAGCPTRAGPGRRAGRRAAHAARPVVPARRRAGREGEVLLGLDIEVALRQLAPATARAHLDAPRRGRGSTPRRAAPSVRSSVARRGAGPGERARRACRRARPRGRAGAHRARRQGPGVGRRRGARPDCRELPPPRAAVGGRPPSARCRPWRAVTRRARRTSTCRPMVDDRELAGQARELPVQAPRARGAGSAGSPRGGHASSPRAAGGRLAVARRQATARAVTVPGGGRRRAADTGAR